MVSNKIKNGLALLAVLALSFPLAACGKQTTLDRIGAVLRTAAIGYQAQIEQLKNQGAISEEKYNSLKRRADAIVQQSDAFANLIAGFGEIAPGDVPRIILQIDSFASQIEAALRDPAWTGQDANIPALRALRWIRATLASTALVVSALFPPKPSPTPTTSGNVPKASPVKPIKTSKIRVDLPPVS